jgi:hypothetical protein
MKPAPRRDDIAHGRRTRPVFHVKHPGCRPLHSACGPRLAATGVA